MARRAQRLRASLFRGRVTQCAAHGAGAKREGFGGYFASQTEVEQFYVAVRAQEYVLGFDVSMNHATGMSRGQSFRNLKHDVQHFSNWRWLPTHLTDGFAFHQ